MTSVAGSWIGQSIPALDGALPVLGHALELRRDPVGLVQRGRDRFGDIFSFRLLRERIHVLTGIRGNEAFFKAPDHVLSPREAYQFTVPVLGKGVAYDLEPELMDYQLRLVHPALRDDRMQSYVRFFAEETDAYLDQWGDRGEIDLLAAMNELTIYAVARCLIGTHSRTPLTDEFVRLYRDLEGWIDFGLNITAILLPKLPLPAIRRRERARRRLVELISEVIAARRISRIESDDFLSTLMTARDPHDKPLTDDVITGMLLSFLLAGQHTSAALATWTGVLLLQNPRHLDLVRAERAAVLGTREPTLAAVKQLVQLEACIKETERLCPPLVMVMRKILTELEFDGYVLPAGDWVLASPAVSHRDPEVFADPLRYDPGRFLPGREEDRRTPNALIGFGAGKHRCIGFAFAYQLVKVIWSVLLRRYELSLVDRQPRPNYTSLVVGPRQPCRVRYRARSSK
jgi:sterol 14-demethylase